MLAAACGGKTHQTLNAVLHNSCFSGHDEEKKSKISGNSGNNSWYMLTSKETKFHHDLWPLTPTSPVCNQEPENLLFLICNLDTFSLIHRHLIMGCCLQRQKQDQLTWPQKSRASSVTSDKGFWIPFEKRLSARSSVLVGVQTMRLSADSGV